jgi:hypothetical protein
MSQNVQNVGSNDANYIGQVLIVTTCWWPSLARLAHLLVLAGCKVSALCPPGHPVRAAPGVTVFDQQAFRPLQALSATIAACRPAVVLPGDDRAVSHLHQLYRTGTDAERILVQRSLGAPTSYPILGSRVSLVAFARELGIAVPEDQAIHTRSELEQWLDRVPGPWVIKIDGAWAGRGVRIATTRAQAHAAFRELPDSINKYVAIKRWLVNRDPYWLADVQRGHAPVVSVQRHIDGRPGNLAMFCRNGEVLAATVAEAVACWGTTGPSTIVRLVNRPGVVADARLLAHALGLSGFYGMDFMVERATGRRILIELNPRATALANICHAPDGDLIDAAGRLFSGHAPTMSRAEAGYELVAHFPLAWHWQADDPRLVECFRDIPWDEPTFLSEMLRPSWPDRPLLARLAAGAMRAARQRVDHVRLAGARRWRLARSAVLRVGSDGRPYDPQSNVVADVDPAASQLEAGRAGRIVPNI